MDFEKIFAVFLKIFGDQEDVEVHHELVKKEDAEETAAV